MPMKKTFCLALVLSALAARPVPAQPGQPPLNPQPAAPNFQERVNQLMARANPPQNSSNLTKFNLDFPGGTARELADAIEKSTGKPVNLIVPPEYAHAVLPPVRVNDVTVPQLFDTLQTGSRRYLNNELQSGFGFNSIDGPKSENSIWTFSVYTNQASSPLTKFSIDFPGGTPKELITAIQNATGKPLNVIIPPEFADMKLPALKMNSVNADQLFHALRSASARTEGYVVGRSPSPGLGSFRSYQQKITGYSFATDGPINDDAIWYFHVESVPTHEASLEKVSRFYALTPYLESGLKVDDITTAVETAWKMAGEKSPPDISFHKDTKLLIAVGEPEKLQTIDSVLQALKPEMSTSPVLRSLMEKRQSEGKTNE
jgi:hypothetical protein